MKKLALIQRSFGQSNVPSFFTFLALHIYIVLFNIIYYYLFVYSTYLQFRELTLLDIQDKQIISDSCVSNERRFIIIIIRQWVFNTRTFVKTPNETFFTKHF